MKVFICGQRSFGAAVLKRLYDDGHEITGVAVAPQNVKKDKMVGQALVRGIKVAGDCERFTADDVPDGTQLIVSAHSHWMVSKKAVQRCEYGGIGYHPSLLPRHRGQDAVRWTVHMHDYITGGTVYRLDDVCDGGGILLQRPMWVDPSWDYHELWRRLFPQGVEMLSEAVGLLESGRYWFTEQDERFATWEPSWDRPRLKRNDLPELGSGGYV